MMTLPEQESQIPSLLESFLTPSRKLFFIKLFKSHLDDETAANEDDGMTAEQLVQSFAAVCDEYFYKLLSFLNSQGQQLTVEDLTDLSDSFLSLFSKTGLKNDEQAINIAELFDCEDHLEMLLLESQTIALPGGQFGLEAISGLAKTAALRNLDTEQCQALIETFRRETHARITDITGLEPEQTEELMDRVRYYCDEIFPLDLQEFSDPEEFLQHLIDQISDFLVENVDTFSGFLLAIDQFEQALLAALSDHDGLIEKHHATIRRFIRSKSDLQPGKTLPELKLALVQVFIKMYLDTYNPDSDTAEQPDDEPEHAEDDPGEMN